MKALRKLFRPQLYYATYDFVLPKPYYEDHEYFNAVAVFDSEEKRDKWVDYEDKYTVDHYLPYKHHHKSALLLPYDYPRIALTYKQAYGLIGDLLFEKSLMDKTPFDELYDDELWVCRYDGLAKEVAKYKSGK